MRSINQKVFIAIGLCFGLCLGHQVFAQDHHDNELDEVIVTAAPLARTVENLAQPAGVLTGEELTQKQSTSIGETVSQELGVSSSYFGPIASRPVIRGQAGERVSVLQDGLDSLDVSALSADHQVGLDAILTERIEIVRGPATLLYGSGAAGGIINLVDSRIPSVLPEGSVDGVVTANYNSATETEALAGEINFGRGNVVFHGDYFFRSVDNIEIPGFAESARLRALEEAEEEGHDEEEEGHDEEEEAFGVVENSDGETRGGSAGFSFVSDNGYVGVSISGFASEYGVPGGHGHEEGHDEEEEEEEEGHEEEEEEIIRVDLDQTRVDVKGEYKLGGFFETAKFRLAYNDYEHVELEGEEIGTQFDTTGFDSRVELRHRGIGDWIGALGLQFRTIDFDAVGDEAFLPPSQNTQISVFAFEEYGFSDATVLQASARLEHQSLDAAGFADDYSEVAFGFSVGIVNQLNNNLSLAANVARTERHPTATELFADGTHVAVSRFERGSVVLGTGFLDKETSTNFDVTFRGNYEQFSWAITGFVNNVDDYIALTPAGFEEDEFPVFDYVQTDAEFYGIEAEGRVELYDGQMGHVHIYGSADFVHAEENGDGDYLPQIPPTRYGLGVDYTGEKLTAGVEAKFYDDQGQFAPNELATDSYNLLSANVAYNYSEALYFYLRGTNLNDDDARQHTSTLKDLVPLPGRSVQAGVVFRF
ncbi:MAG: TonB-dependent receptor [Pseudomonadota bacterium]